MGRLKWTPAVAMDTDINLIMLAYEGYRDEQEENDRTIYTAAGISLPPRKHRSGEEVKDPRALSERIKERARLHNAALKARTRQKTRS